jgi:hypothetical protein
MTHRNAVQVHVFPAGDAALLREVERALADLDETRPERDQKAFVESSLRRWYRTVSIRTRDSIGGYPDDPTIVWYVYRDGRIRRHNPARDRLYAAMGAAIETCRDSESAISAARAVASFAGFGADGTQGEERPEVGDDGPHAGLSERHGNLPYRR